MNRDELPVFDQVPPGLATDNMLLADRLVRRKSTKAVGRLKINVPHKTWNIETEKSELSTIDIKINLYSCSECRPNDESALSSGARLL